MSLNDEELSGPSPCVYLEVGSIHDDESLEMSEYPDSGLLPASSGNCTCGHTARATGPDFKPASKKTCVVGRACYKPRGHF